MLLRISYNVFKLVGRDLMVKSDDLKKFKMVRAIKAEEFNCSRCLKHKKSKNIAININNPNEKLCNGCYGEALLKKEIING